MSKNIHVYVDLLKEVHEVCMYMYMYTVHLLTWSVMSIIFLVFYFFGAVIVHRTDRQIL